MRQPSEAPSPKEPPLRVPRHNVAVTPEIIERACRRNSRHCMIAEAVKAQIPGATTVCVDMMTVRFSIPEKGLRYTYPTPALAQDALARFDRGLIVEPITVRLKNGQATSMVWHEKQDDGKRMQRQLHKLGRKKLRVTPASGGTRIETEIVGGKPPPVQKPKHGSNSSIRVFGIRNWTGEWRHASEIEGGK
jgi:hypothetical protein